MKICDFTNLELNEFREKCNFTEIELKCFEMKAKDYTNTKIALELNISESTVCVIMRKIRTKITKVLNWEV